MTIETQTTNPIKTTKRRRWFRFRLRTLLIFVMLISVPLGWVGWELDQRRKEKEVVAWIEENDGTIQFRSNPDNRSWWEKTKDNWLGGGVWRVNLYGTKDIDLSPLAELKYLRTLALYGTQVSDLSPLAEMKNLKSLGLWATGVNDVSPLAELKNLKYLDISNTQVSDLSPLAKLKNLQQLYLRSTPVTKDQVQELRLALPNCKFN